MNQNWKLDLARTSWSACGRTNLCQLRLSDNHIIVARIVTARSNHAIVYHSCDMHVSSTNYNVAFVPTPPHRFFLIAMEKNFSP